MRIVGGEYRGRRLVTPEGQITRPTTDRVREAVFNILAHRDDIDLNKARIIDLFAGSGALGFEALSRGGAFCLFVEQDADARGAIRANQETLELAGCTRIHRRSAVELGTRPAMMGEPFDLAFLDPPYKEDLVDPALAALRDGDWLAPGALCVVEQGRKEGAPSIEGFTQHDERRFGTSMIRFLTFG